MITRLLVLATAVAELLHRVDADASYEDCPACERIRRYRDARDVLTGDRDAIHQRALVRLRRGRWHVANAQLWRRE